MCKQITEILEGNLSLISEKDKGSRFILSIPYTKALTDNLISLNSLITHTEQDASDLADAIDMKQLSNTLNIFSDAEKKIFYNSVSQSIEEISPQLKQAIYDKNTVIATQLINKLKGAYSNIHATRLIAYCDTLETSLLSGITEDEINKQLNEVEYETKKTLQAVENLIL